MIRMRLVAITLLAGWWAMVADTGVPFSAAPPSMSGNASAGSQRLPGSTGDRTRTHLDLASFGRRYVWEEPGDESGVEIKSWNAAPKSARSVGIVWWEERDVRQVRVRFAGGAAPQGIQVQYWALRWPADPPHMPTIEDPLDDPWQGHWITARTEVETKNSLCAIRFQPLAKKENPRAGNLPGVNYRRTLKVRVVLPEQSPSVAAIEVLSETTLKPLPVRIELGCGETPPATWRGRLTVDNGLLLGVRPWEFTGDDRFDPAGTWSQVKADRPKGVLAELMAAVPSPPGSNDITVVTVHAEASVAGRSVDRTFSFSTLDLERGPIYVPDFHAYVTRADDHQPFATQRFAARTKIRELIPAEPEQTFERATREIPPQDPWNRQDGGRVYLPVAADASWQKFAVEYGGNIFISKGGTKAKGGELRRLGWEGDSLRFRVGTGPAPYYRDDRQARVSVAEESLPIVINRWRNEGLEYEEEALATLLHGPLDPNDPARSEQTPAILMMQIKVHNPGTQPLPSQVWLTIEPDESLKIAGRRIYATSNPNGPYPTPRLRAAIVAPEEKRAPALLQPAPGKENSVRCVFEVAGGATRSVWMYLPFVSDLADSDAKQLESIVYAPEREKVAAYWRAMIDRTSGFATPEPKFNHLARSIVPHIHISTTKDPKSGLFMVPAASYGYQVFANEACFQTLLLDALGDTDRAGQYLRTLTALQGTRPFPGNYREPHDGVFHGARVDDEYDYTAHHYGLDHGTVLWALAEHYFFTRDAGWLRETIPHMLKAIEWIQRQREATRQCNLNGEPVMHYGLLPAGHLEDNPDWGYWFSVNAYCVAGMLETARAMRDIGHPEAARLAGEAQAYREDLRTAVLRASRSAPVARMRDGTYSPYVPTRAYQRFRYFGPLRVQYYSRYGRPEALPCYRLAATREVLYGPMILLNLGIFGAVEPIAPWILDDWEDNSTLSSSGGFNVHGFTEDRFWFSQGGMVFQSNLQNPILVYLKRNETAAAIRGLYNNFVACLYPDVNAFTEEYRMWGRGSGPFYKSPDEARFVNRLRDALVLEAGEDLWLACGVPRRWLADRDGIRVQRINSCYGPVAMRLAAGDQPRTITGKVVLPPRKVPGRVWLYVRVPQGRIRSVQINGQPWSRLETDRERIELPLLGRPLEVLIRY